ncbi:MULTISPECIES: hypothetical protein [Chryseobacterium]|uniref:Uncharacterized protein n=1 Tax=Chryseobacterium geocarposphaerae TaxID=1416776 RepID=A0A2M9C721_9FLAO|nr:MULTISPECIES: hypothetical protein [Chryseobacterium]MPS64710.1 hypothetical protein [Chryseobacterium sp.]PJJ66638.1 hypothetical protein CLV73_0627 [Chryseobacterium geocarposphaerae]
MLKIKILSLLIISLFSNFCFGQNEKEYREEFTLKIPVDSIQFYQQEVPKSKYFVKEGVLQIFPGENLYVETEISGNKITSMKVVKENLNPAKTIEIKFSQTVEGRKHEQMVLEVKNPFDKELNYDAMMFIVGHDNWMKTSIIPIKPKLMNFEMWNDVIITLVLNNWRIK